MAGDGISPKERGRAGSQRVVYLIWFQIRRCGVDPMVVACIRQWFMWGDRGLLGEPMRGREVWGHWLEQNEMAGEEPAGGSSGKNIRCGTIVISLQL